MRLHEHANVSASVCVQLSTHMYVHMQSKQTLYEDTISADIECM